MNAQTAPPAPLASTAMEAAREITGYIPTDWDPFYIAAKKKKILDDANVIEKHFQPLLAKVEETETYLASRKLISLGNGAFAAVDQPVVDLVIALRADLAAKEAALKHLTWILPMAKGYAAAHPVGSNQAMVDAATEFILTIKT